MSSLFVVGIDYSMTNPCICLYHSESGPFSFQNCTFHYYTPVTMLTGKFLPNVTGHLSKVYTSDMERFLNISSWALGVIQESGKTPQVFLEGYSMGSKGLVFQIAENTAILKVALHIGKIPYVCVPPTTNKKFATGKGNADKQKMYDTFYSETNIDLPGLITPKRKGIVNPVSDIVDSYYLCKYGMSQINPV